ncbi:double-stranded RNA binding domain protein [Aspergillus oryzae]|uniref:Double-stranded RNA binding domain protein n=1 Tax=Aspergillus oryzae TaxID=5062 RepID=A0A1S9DCZ5_ASPOZ|nr:double-stranded RNA binding domain protein [Aspergillus oryzae]
MAYKAFPNTGNCRRNKVLSQLPSLANPLVLKMSPAAHQIDDCYTIADFEIGKRLFTTHMAVQLVVASPEGREIGSLSQLDALITGYDFEEAIATLVKAGLDVPRTNLVCDETYEDVLYKIIGRTRLGDSKESFPTLLGQLPLLDLSTDGVDLTVTATTQRVANGLNLSPPGSEADNWKYTCRLWEDAQGTGEEPKVEEACISNFPPRFRITIRYCGVEASGEGRNKKTARHLAARRVCERLKLRLSL